MGFYDVPNQLTKSKEVYNGEKLFMIHFEKTPTEGKKVTVDEVHTDIPMIIQKHTNPLNKNLHDMKAKYLDSTGDFIHMGNIVTIDDDKTYMAVTEPSSNGVYSEYKILPLTDDMTFTVDTPVDMKCVIANKGFYDETSYVNDTTVFEDKDTRATIVQYNAKTSQLTLFDDVCINDKHYKIVKIDNYTFKEYDENFGVLQMVVIDTPFGEIKCNNKEALKGIVLQARVKDKILNSISRELLCDYNRTKRGDYISFTYDRTEKGEMITETYLIVNKPTMGIGYDKSLLYLCENAMNLLDNEGNVVNVPLYFEDNRMRIDKVSDGEFIKIRNSSYMAMCQYNDVTKRLRNKVTRIMVDGDVYSITGTDPTSTGLLILGLELDKIDSNDDNTELGIANYKSQMEEINKVNPPTPSGNIVGAAELYKGYPEEYSLQGADQYVTWSVDCSYIQITQDGIKCNLYFNNLSDANKTFVLSATYGGVEFNKVIATKRL